MAGWPTTSRRKIVKSSPSWLNVYCPGVQLDFRCPRRVTAYILKSLHNRGMIKVYSSHVADWPCMRTSGGPLDGGRYSWEWLRQSGSVFPRSPLGAVFFASSLLPGGMNTEEREKAIAINQIFHTNHLRLSLKMKFEVKFPNLINESGNRSLESPTNSFHVRSVSLKQRILVRRNAVCISLKHLYFVVQY